MDKNKIIINEIFSEIVKMDKKSIFISVDDVVLVIPLFP